MDLRSDVKDGANVGSDDAALAALAQEQPGAFRALYERYLGPVYGYCHVRLGNREAAEDATAEVFLKAFAGIGNFRHGNFAAWLFRIAQNVVIDTYRRRPNEPIEAAGDPPDGSPTPEEVAVARAERAALREALAALPTDQRAVIELQLAGWSGPQIAAALGKSPAAVKMLRFRALGRLRMILAASTGGELREAHDERA